MVNLSQKINRSRPTIGITGPDKGGEAAWLFTALGIWIAGGKPVHVTPARPRTADGLQGLVIGGGADVDPTIYEQEHLLNDYLQQTIRQPNKNVLQRVGRFLSWLYFPALFFFRKLLSRKLTFGLDKARDHLELQLLDQAVKKDLPVMGICRGAQLMNVYFGGTLHKSIHTFYTEAPNPASILPVKVVEVKAGSKLQHILCADKLDVNALHKQAVKEPGANICIAAWEPNGVVQAIEHTTLQYMIGVQWHPEYLPQKSRHRKLFKALVQQAKAVQAQIEEQDVLDAIAAPREVYNEIEKQGK
ncbi:gamma-glutamyl-gamma-aminobutyrate hydrolase family protein [Pontibacter sp. H249]|uniref:gamma-glutamyl-gamma-aminobutyrate hydrolase family protein n=1 Tax=Pontibacter sp. H249 TaxID=3133420 RepID=UPI0030C08B51